MEKWDKNYLFHMEKEDRLSDYTNYYKIKERFQSLRKSRIFSENLILENNKFNHTSVKKITSYTKDILYLLKSIQDIVNSILTNTTYESQTFTIKRIQKYVLILDDYFTDIAEIQSCSIINNSIEYITPSECFSLAEMYSLSIDSFAYITELYGLIKNCISYFSDKKTPFLELSNTVTKLKDKMNMFVHYILKSVNIKIGTLEEELKNPTSWQSLFWAFISYYCSFDNIVITPELDDPFSNFYQIEQRLNSFNQDNICGENLCLKNNNDLNLDMVKKINSTKEGAYSELYNLIFELEDSSLIKEYKEVESIIEKFVKNLNFFASYLGSIEAILTSTFDMDPESSYIPPESQIPNINITKCNAMAKIFSLAIDSFTFISELQRLVECGRFHFGNKRPEFLDDFDNLVESLSWDISWILIYTLASLDIPQCIDIVSDDSEQEYEDDKLPCEALFISFIRFLNRTNVNTMSGNYTRYL